LFQTRSQRPRNSSETENEITSHVIKNYGEIDTDNHGRDLLDSLELALNKLTPSSVMEKATRDIRTRLRPGKTFVIGFGKASLGMYQGIRKNIGTHVEHSSVIIPENLQAGIQDTGLRVLRAPHPLPDNRTVEASRSIVAALGRLGEDDNVIVLVSGGASSLFEIPAGDIDIDSISYITSAMMNRGSDIYDLNRMRQVMSSVKGGKLASLLWPANVMAYIISDVPGDDPALIGSGPITFTEVKKDEIRAIIEKYRLADDPRIMKIEGMFDYQFPKKACFRKIHLKIVLRNHDFVRVIASSLRRKNSRVLDIGSGLGGDVQDVASGLSVSMEKLSDLFEKETWFVGGGETTVNVRGNGKGGRNQELVVRFANEMSSRGRDYAFMSAGTDGIDGSSDAMGGIVCDSAFRKIDPGQVTAYLKNNDTGTLLKIKNMAMISGATGNNVSDVFAGFIGRKKR
jgi:glycerate 2-kinase